LSGNAATPVHLDTSFLIRALVPGSMEAVSLGAWITEGRPLAMSALAWGELLCGPLEADDEVLVKAVVRTIVPLDAEAASLAAGLFNAGGRRRGSFPDCLVAATCVQAGAALATANPMDFQRFAGAGPELVQVAG
jgi:predicted nucleic acid-binding protein